MTYYALMTEKRELREGNSLLNRIVDRLLESGDKSTLATIAEVRLRVYNELVDVIETLEK